MPNKMRFLAIGEDYQEFAPDVIVEVLRHNILRLEPRGTGSRFPTVMDVLFSVGLSAGRAKAALRELAEIEAELRRVGIETVEWKPGNGLQVDETMQPVNRRASNLFEYFVDANEKPLISRLRDGVERSLSSRQRMRLTYPNSAREKTTQLAIAFAVVLLGVAWMLLGRLFFPNLAIYYIRAARLPVWTFGMDVVMVGVAILLASLWPALGDWFGRYPLAAVGIIMITAVAWLITCFYAGFLPG